MNEMMNKPRSSTRRWPSMATPILRLSTLIALCILAMTVERTNASQTPRNLGSRGIWGTIDKFLTTDKPSIQPTRSPSIQPSNTPTSQPSDTPTMRPSQQPSIEPTHQPSTRPSLQPSTYPSITPSSIPTNTPTNPPSKYPTTAPSKIPTVKPSRYPSSSPSYRPSLRPTASPSSQPMTGSTFQVRLTLNLRKWERQMTESEIKTFETETLSFATQCVSTSSATDMAIETKSQRMSNTLLEIKIIVSGRVSSQNVHSINSVIIDCFQNNYNDLTMRLEGSISSDLPETPSEEQDNDITMILIYVGIGSVALIVIVLGLLYGRRRKNSISTFESKLQKLQNQLNNFDLDCEPKIHPVARTEGGGSGSNAFFKSEMPSIMRQINEDVTLDDESEPTHHVIPSELRVPNRSRRKFNDETQSRHTSMSSVTDNNQYIYPDVDVDEERRKNFDARIHPSNINPPNAAWGGGESVISSSSSGIVMGLNIPIQAAIKAREISTDGVEEARLKVDTNKPDKLATVKSVFQDLCFVAPNIDTAFNRRISQTKRSLKKDRAKTQF